MIGLDAAEWWIVEHYVGQGVMPHVDKLLSASKFATIDADRPFKAEGRWAEILTGRSSAENQYWSIVDFDPLTYTPWYERSSHGSYFYARPDLTSIVFDVPNSVIVEDAHGIQITAWGSHAAQFPSASQPSRILPDIDRTFGVHEGMLSDGHNGWNNEEYLDSLQAAMEEGVRRRVQICRWLVEQRPDWDLFFVVLGETHVAEHQYLHGLLTDHPLHHLPLAAAAGERLRRTFAAVDQAVGDLVELFGDDVTVVLFAAHGMEANKSDVLAGVLMPEVLHRLAFGEALIEFPEFDPAGEPIVLDERVLPRHWLEKQMVKPTPVTSSGPKALAKKAVRGLRHRLPATELNRFESAYWRRPDWWKMHIRQPAPYESRDLLGEASRLELESVASASWYRPYWSQMRAFVLPSFSDCHLRLNVKGRERDGIIDLADYQQACDEIEAELRQLVDARTGTPIVDQVLRLRAEDPMAEIGPAPDLIVTFNAVTDAVSHPAVGVIGPTPLMRMGEHTPRGWAAIATPDGERTDLGTLAPKDLTATVVDLLGLAPSPLVTGRSALPRPS